MLIFLLRRAAKANASAKTTTRTKSFTARALMLLKDDMRAATNQEQNLWLQKM
jgi:hypothetical protein